MGLRKSFYADVTALHPEVTGSCLTMRVQFPNGRKTNFIVDCGLFQEKEKGYNSLNKEDFPFRSENIEFALITHNHADHMGRLPMLIKGGFNGFIYTTESTAQLLPISLKDSYQIMKEEAKNSKTKQPYCEYDVEEVYNRLKPCKLEETVYVSPYIKVTFFDNGHLIGAAMILVQISYPGQEDINYLFTGDYKPYNIFKVVDELPWWVKEMPLNIVIESTYGDTEMKDVQFHFESDIKEVLEAKKSILISVFAQGRAQEVLYVLKKMQDDGRISKEIPIYLDGNLAHQYTRMYKSGKLEIDEGDLEFLPMNFHWTDKDNRDEVMRDCGQKIVLTTSGMLDHGPAQLYVPQIIGRENWAIYITGYCADGTFGRKLMDSQGGKITLQGEELTVRAKVFSTGEFSSHAKADELENLLRMFTDLRLVLINHGEKEVKCKFAERLENAKVAKRVEILGEHTVRTDHYGFEKIMGSKLYSVPRVVKETKADRIKKNKKGQKVKIFCRRIHNCH